MRVLDQIKSKLNNNLYKYETPLGDQVDVEFRFNAPASDQDIAAFEKDNNILLPEQYKSFLKYTNGAVLFKGTGYDEGGYYFPSLNELINTRNKIKNIGYELDDNWLVFAEVYGGSSDFLLFDLNRLAEKPREMILDGDAGYQSGEWEYIKGDFFSWLNRVIITNGSMYWRWY